MWTNENRARYDRSALRYPSDVTDEEWAHIKGQIPPAKRGGNTRSSSDRSVSNRTPMPTLRNTAAMPVS